ncbi:MAG: hypothetical protein ABIW38_08560 [Ferruginibacter sp.]
MKKFSLIFTALITLTCANAASPVKHSPILPLASSIIIPIGKEGKTISLLELSTISRENLESLTGRKMNGVEALAFKRAQKKINKGINSEGVVSSKKLHKMFFADGETGFHFGGFALGFFGSIVGVLIAYLMHDDNRQNRIKWAWLGVSISLALVGILFALAYGTAY